MKIERIKIDLNTMEEKSERYRCLIYNNGIRVGYIGIDGQGTVKFEIKCTRPRNGNATVTVRIFGEKYDLIGGGNSFYPAEALLEALRNIGFKVTISEIDGLGLFNYADGWDLNSVKYVMNAIMNMLGYKQQLKVLEIKAN